MKLRRAAAIALPSLLLLSGCSSAPSAVATHPTPAVTARQALLTSLARTTGTSFRADMTIDETLSATGANAAPINSFASRPITLKIAMAAASQRRLSMTIDEVAAGQSLKVVTVVYDGVVYVSTNGGGTFRTVQSSGALPSQYASDSALTYLQSVGAVTDAGAGTVDGVAVERYSAQLDGAKIIAFMRSALASQTPQVQALFNSLTFNSGSMEVAIDHQGRIVTEHGPIDASLDLGALAPTMKGTRLNVNEVIDAHFHDYGSAVTVTRPAAFSTT